MKTLATPLVALWFGGFFLCAETCDHLDVLLTPLRNWSSLPFYDWLAGLFLVAAAMHSRRDWENGRALLAAAWGFDLSLMVGAFIDHVVDWNTPVPGNGLVSEHAHLVIIAILGAVAVCALIGTLRSPEAPTRPAPSSSVPLSA
jgi:hypothetical protein